MSDNLQKLVGLAAMAVLVVLGVVLTNDDDTDFSRNRSFRETAGTFAGADRVKEADPLEEVKIRLEQIDQTLQKLEADLSTHKPAVESWIDYVTVQCSQIPPGLISSGIEEGGLDPHYLSSPLNYGDSGEGPSSKDLLSVHLDAFDQCVVNFLTHLEGDVAQEVLSTMGYPSGVINSPGEEMTNLVCPLASRPTALLYGDPHWFEVLLENGRVWGVLVKHGKICS